jgi:hypothetical protein
MTVFSESQACLVNKFGSFKEILVRETCEYVEDFDHLTINLSQITLQSTE